MSLTDMNTEHTQPEPVERLHSTDELPVYPDFLQAAIERAESARVLGVAPDKVNHWARKKLDALGSINDWDAQKLNAEHLLLTEILTRPPTSEVYDKWIGLFQESARASREANNIQAARAALNNAKSCIRTRALSLGIGGAEVLEQLAELESNVGSLYIPRSQVAVKPRRTAPGKHRAERNRLGSIKNVVSLLGSKSMAYLRGPKLGSNDPGEVDFTAENQNTGIATEKKPNRIRKAIMATILGAAAVSTTFVGLSSSHSLENSRASVAAPDKAPETKPGLVFTPAPETLNPLAINPLLIGMPLHSVESSALPHKIAPSTVRLAQDPQIRCLQPEFAD
jgi:HPt (histidine-containing phosphotransfer) domain-containing protein